MISRKDIRYAYKIFYDTERFDRRCDNYGETTYITKRYIETVSTVVVAQNEDTARFVFGQLMPYEIKNIEEIGTVCAVVSIN